jgi:hypothetical protein
MRYVGVDGKAIDRGEMRCRSGDRIQMVRGEFQRYALLKPVMNFWGPINASHLFSSASCFHTSSICVLLTLRDRVLRAYKTTGKSVVSCFKALRCLVKRLEDKRF